MEYRIDKRVPLPPRVDPVPLEKLKLSESVAFPLEDRQKVASKASRLKRTKGMWFTIQKMDAETCRVWRVK